MIPTPERVIVSRHPAAVEFLRREVPDLPPDTPVLATATAEDVAGRIVYGNLPLDLAALALRVYAVVFSGRAPRGSEYSLADMDAAGARLVEYIVLDPERARAVEERAWLDGWSGHGDLFAPVR